MNERSENVALTTDPNALPPGPYVVTGPNGWFNHIGIGRETGPNGYVDPIGVAYGAGKQVEAIANLFAAAPDLLTAARKAVSLLLSHRDSGNILDELEKAIAKAEGRS